jgi:hypothetical protein
MNELRSPFYLKTRCLCFLIFIFFSCTNSKTTDQKLNRKAENTGNDILHIDPRTFTDSELLLSDIADDINYIPLDNSIPIGPIRSPEIRNNTLFFSLDNINLIKFDINGRNPQPIGREGRGPGEYLSCTSYTIDNKTGNIYIRGKREAIMVYSSNGAFIREFQLPHSDDGSVFGDIEFLDTSLFIAQYISMGKARYNWIITDTLGNIVSYKQNYLPPFVSQTGNFGGITKFRDKISYWDIYNDTVFTISPDFSYRVSCIFPPGNYRCRQEDIKFNSPQQYIEEVAKICMTLKLFETNNYWVYRYRYNMYGIAFIDKRNRKTKWSSRAFESLGIDNDLDGGTVFLPESYYAENGNEYLIGVVNSYQLIAHVASEAFKNSKPKYPEKKKELEKLANRLKETDNPVVMIVKLKK